MVEYRCIVSGMHLKPQNGAFGYGSITLISVGDENILIDTGSYGQRQIVLSCRETINVTAVVLTHLHYDHCSNVDLFEDIPIYVHIKELWNIQHNLTDFDLYKPFRQMENSLNIVPIESETEIANGVKIIETFGHTMGHISVIFQSKGSSCIVAGDSVKSYIDYLSQNLYGNAQEPILFLKTKEMIRNNFDIIIPGHNSPIRRNELYSDNMSFRIF